MRHRSKAEWASAKARELREQAQALRGQRVTSGDWRGVRRKMEALRHLDGEAARFERIARRHAEAA